MLRRHDPHGGALATEAWIAEEWGRLDASTPRPVVDALLAATARVHGLTMVTRNIADFDVMGVDVFNPFEK
jgi:predicted nucleic acid-binding protein